MIPLMLTWIRDVRAVVAFLILDPRDREDLCDLMQADQDRRAAK